MPPEAFTGKWVCTDCELYTQVFLISPEFINNEGNPMCVGCARSNKISLDNLLYQSAVKRMRPLSIPKSTPALNRSLRSHFR